MEEVLLPDWQSVPWSAQQDVRLATHRAVLEVQQFPLLWEEGLCEEMEQLEEQPEGQEREQLEAQIAGLEQQEELERQAFQIPHPDILGK